jgi:hypothetical protein
MPNPDNDDDYDVRADLSDIKGNDPVAEYQSTCINRSGGNRKQRWGKEEACARGFETLSLGSLRSLSHKKKPAKQKPRYLCQTDF